MAKKVAKVRGKDKSPRKNGELSVVPQGPKGMTAKELLKDDPNVMYWIERVEGFKAALEVHMKANYKRMRKDSPITPQRLARAGYEYLRSELERGRPLTVTGLAMAVGLDRTHLLKLQNMESKEPDKLAFKDIVMKLRAFIEMYVEQQLHMRQNPTGSIFVLKNFGWQDKLDIDHAVYAGLTQEEKEQAKARVLNFAE